MWSTAAVLLLTALCIAAAEDKAQGLYSVSVTRYYYALSQTGVPNPACDVVNCITLYNENIITA
jgi:hypothetical protein